MNGLMDFLRLRFIHGKNLNQILDGRVAHSLLLELFTDEGIGTMIEAAP